MLDFDVQKVVDAQYRALLEKQVAFCEKNKDAIYNRAKRTYSMAAFKKVPAYTKICCDFFMLEQALVHFDPYRKNSAKEHGDNYNGIGEKYHE